MGLCWSKRPDGSLRWARTRAAIGAPKSGRSSELREEELPDVPGRMFTNGSSETACLCTQQGRKGTNQDAMLVWEDFASRSDTILCGIFDGHGPFGHVVAKKVRDSLPLKLCNQWRAPTSDGSSRGSLSSERTSSCTDEDRSETKATFPQVYLTLRHSFLRAFKLMDKELKCHATIDCFCSGTTAVTLVKQGQDIVIANVGDSRAVLGTRDEDNSLLAVQLTVDLKPNIPSEAARIQKCKGRVFSLPDEPDVSRLWLPDSDSPGLAMARALGDFCLKNCGLISVPDVIYCHLTYRDQFIVLATDGVWDVLSNKEVVDIVASAPTRDTAARTLIDAAVRTWCQKFPSLKNDDCAAVCLFLTPPSDRDHIFPLNSTEQATSFAKEGHTSMSDSSSQAHNSQYVSVPDGGQSTRGVRDSVSSSAEEEWSALKGVTRVNTLLNLPRFLPSKKSSTSLKTWL